MQTQPGVTMSGRADGWNAGGMKGRVVGHTDGWMTIPNFYRERSKDTLCCMFYFCVCPVLCDQSGSKSVSCFLFSFYFFSVSFFLRFEVRKQKAKDGRDCMPHQQEYMPTRLAGKQNRRGFEQVDIVFPTWDNWKSRRFFSFDTPDQLPQLSTLDPRLSRRATDTPSLAHFTNDTPRPTTHYRARGDHHIWRHDCVRQDLAILLDDAKGGKNSIRSNVDM